MRTTALFGLGVAATPAAADPGDFGHMMGYGYGSTMLLGPILWIIVLGLVVAGVIWFARQNETGKRAGDTDARAALDLRFAQGEIDAEDYAARKKLLSE